jgi:ketosteroid isomerase-like protein
MQLKGSTLPILASEKLMIMEIVEFIDKWIEVGNSYDTEKYLAFYAEDAVFDDPSVGRKFNGRIGIKEYFDSYFIGYKTQTRKVELILLNGNQAHLQVEFTGDFPEGKIGGTFDFTFEAGKIIYVLADLI